MTRRSGLFAFVAVIFGVVTAKAQDHKGWKREHTFYEKGKLVCAVTTDYHGKLLNVSHNGRSSDLAANPHFANTDGLVDRDGFVGREANKEFEFLENGKSVFGVITDAGWRLLSVSHHGRVIDFTADGRMK